MYTSNNNGPITVPVSVGRVSVREEMSVPNTAVNVPIRLPLSNLHV